MSLKDHYPNAVLELAGGIRLRFSERTGAADYCGAIVEHPSAGTETGECSGAIWFEGQGDGHPEWKVESEQPLTLSPSLLCHCGLHGFVQQGRWVPA